MNKKAYLTILLFIGMMAITGCGKLGESEATEMVKNSCKFPDSFKKIEYEVNESTGLSHLDFNAKNGLGETVQGRAYFILTQDKIQMIDTTNIPINVLEELEKIEPANFVANTKAYNEIAKIQRENEIDMKIFMDGYNRLNGIDNYFVWQNVASQTPKINKIIKEYKEAYDRANPSVQKYFEQPINYFKIVMSGDFLYWDGYVERPTEYPDEEPILPRH